MMFIPCNCVHRTSLMEEYVGEKRVRIKLVT